MQSDFRDALVQAAGWVIAMFLTVCLGVALVPGTPKPYSTQLWTAPRSSTVTRPQRSHHLLSLRDSTSQIGQLPLSSPVRPDIHSSAPRPTTRVMHAGARCVGCAPTQTGLAASHGVLAAGGMALLGGALFGLRRSVQIRATDDNTGTGPAPPNGETEDVHVVSLLRPKRLEDPAADLLWAWKDAVLGDGNDFFVPRPNTLRRLAAAFVASASRRVPITECVVLANCARIDVYVVTSASTATVEVVRHVSGQLLVQIQAWQDQEARGPLLQLPWADREDRVAWPDADRDTRTLASMSVANQHLPVGFPAVDVQALQGVLVALSGREPVTRHCCLVAAGLGPGSRPFNPFNSRDAHIMLQLKRTLEATEAPAVIQSTAFSSPSQALPPPCRVRLSTILKCSLSAGKAARSPNCVPEILPLKRFGANPRSGRYALPISAADRTARTAAEEAVLASAVEPAVRRCQTDLQALCSADVIKRLRAEAEAAAAEVLAATYGPIIPMGTLQQVRRSTQRVLHTPTVALRSGQAVDTDAVVRAVAEAASAVATPSAKPVPGP